MAVSRRSLRMRNRHLAQQQYSAKNPFPLDDVPCPACRFSGTRRNRSNQMQHEANSEKGSRYGSTAAIDCAGIAQLAKES